jgi:antitoxin PrlF
MGAITSKGQVTIPKPIRNALGVKPGDHVRFEILPGGDVRVVPVPADALDITRWERPIGCAGPTRSWH